MAKYLGIKLVDAEEMTLDAFQAKYPGRVVNPASGDGVNGYCVTYQDGYQGWCPKEVFEEANITVQDNPQDNIPMINYRLSQLLLSKNNND